MRFMWSLGFLLVLWTSVSAQVERVPLNAPLTDPRIEELSQKLSTFKNIVFDVRNYRGGHGDIAATYLTINEMLKRFKYHRTITIITNEVTAPILKKLAADDPDFLLKTDIVSVEDLQWFRPADLYIDLAGDSDDLNTRTVMFRRVAPQGHKPSHHEDGRVLVDNHTIFVSQTTLGATERPASPYGQMGVGQQIFRTRPAGLGEFESGIYWDYSAYELGHLTKSAALKSGIEFLKDKDKNKNLSTMELRILYTLQARQEDKNRIGFLYGASHDQVSTQVNSYMKGISRTRKHKKPLVILSPSKWMPDDFLDERIFKRIHIIDQTDAFELDRLEDNHIYVVRTGFISPRLFNTLMAASDLPPILSGDGAMSAAIQLGRPFAMTGIEWNYRNIDIFRMHLENLQVDETKVPITQIFPDFSDPDLSRLGTLRFASTEFGSVPQYVPSLLGAIIENAYQVREMAAHPENFWNIWEQLSDSKLKAELLGLRIRELPAWNRPELHNLNKSAASNGNHRPEEIAKTFKEVLTRLAKEDDLRRAVLFPDANGADHRTFFDTGFGSEYWKFIEYYIRPSIDGKKSISKSWRPIDIERAIKEMSHHFLHLNLLNIAMILEKNSKVRAEYHALVPKISGWINTSKVNADIWISLTELFIAMDFENPSTELLDEAKIKFIDRRPLRLWLVDECAEAMAKTSQVLKPPE